MSPETTPNSCTCGSCACESADLVQHLHKLIEAITFDDSGTLGRGGNGGLLSRDTIKLTDQLRMKLATLAVAKPPTT
jgi:hypothetical protein